MPWFWTWTLRQIDHHLSLAFLRSSGSKAVAGEKDIKYPVHRSWFVNITCCRVSVSQWGKPPCYDWQGDNSQWIIPRGRERWWRRSACSTAREDATWDSLNWWLSWFRTFSFSTCWSKCPILLIVIRREFKRANYVNTKKVNIITIR